MKTISPLLICLSLSISATAQQLVAGYAQAEKQADTIVFNIHTYSVFAPNDTCVIAFGDGISYQPAFTSALLYDSLYENSAVVSHVYSDSGTYRALIKAGYLIDSILNIENPAAQKFNIEIKVNNNPAAGYESDMPPVYTDDIFQLDINGSCKIVHSEAATDPDGDEIKYKMVGYTVNNGDASLSFIPDATNYLNFHTNNGSFSWNGPLLPGLYAFEFHADTYRDGIFLSNSVRKVLINAPCWSPTSVEDETDSEIHIYPNPVTSYLSLHLPTPYTGQNVSIYNTLGILVASKTIQSTAFNMDLSAFPSGVYTLILNDVTTGKFIKQ